MLLGEAFIAIVPQMDQSAAGKLKVAATAIGAAVGGTVAAGIQEALDVGKANDKLRAQLGLSASESAKLGKTAGELYASNYGESMGEVNEAIKSVIQQVPGISAASGPVLKDVAAGALDVSRVFDQDFNEVIKAAGQLVKTGLAPDATSAMDLISKGFQGGADKAGDLLDTFNEYGTQFRKLGLDGPQALGLIQQGLKGGARDADIVADAFKEFSIRAIDGSKTSAAGFEAIGLNAQKMTAIFAKGGPEASKNLAMVIDKLNAMKDPVARDAAGVALFGTQWEDLGGAFKSLDLDTATQQLGNVAGATKNLVDQSTQAKIDGFIRSIKAGFVQVIGEQVLPKLISMAKFIGDNATAFKTLAAVIAAIVVGYWAFVAAQAAAAAATVAWTVIQRAAAIASNAWAVAQWALNSALLANPIALVVVAIVALIAIIVLAYKNSDKFREVVTKAWNVVKVAMSAVADWFVKTAWPALKTALQALGAVFVWLWKNVIVPVWNGINKAIGAVFDWLITQFFPKLKPIFVALGEVMYDLWKKQIEPAWKGIQKVIEPVGKWIANTLWPLIKKAIDFIGDHMGWLKTVAKVAWEGIKIAINVVWLAIQGIFKLLELAIKALGAIFQWLWKNVVVIVWDGIVAVIKVAWAGIKVAFDTGTTIIKALAATFQWLWNNIVTPVWNGIKLAIDVAWAAIKVIFAAGEAAIKALGAVFTWFWQNLIVPTWNGIKDTIMTVWNFIRDSIFNPIIAFLQGTFTAAWNNFKTMLTILWTAIKDFINITWTFIRDSIFVPIINFLVNNFMTAWNNFKNGVSLVWTAIKDAISIIWNFIRDSIFVPIINFLVNNFMTAWNNFKAGVTAVWNALRDAISVVWNFIRDNIFNPIVNFITQTIPNAFRTGVDAVGKAWDNLKEKAKTPVRFVIEKVINGGLIKGLNWFAGKIPGVPNIPDVPMPFATGGVLPGYTPGRDVHRFVSRTGGQLLLSGGEAIMRPEWTRAMGRGFVDMFNGAARRGGVHGVRNLFKRFLGHRDHDRRTVASGRLGPVGAFASGGVIDWVKKLFMGEDGGKGWAVKLARKSKKKGTGDGIGDALSSAWTALTNPVDTLSNFMGGLLSKAKGKNDFLKDAGAKGVEAILNKVKTWLSDKVGDLFNSGGGTVTGTLGSLGGAIGYAKMWELVKKQFPTGVSLISGFRAGATTLSGNKSYHASGRAVDMSPVRAVAEWIRANYGANTKELITPWRDLMLHNGKPHKYSAAIEAQHGVTGHNAHIHWAMKNGGIFKLFDNGGILRPNDIGINRLGQPEAVLTPSESRGLKAMQTGELIDKIEELIEVCRTIGADVGDEINGVGRRLRIQRRTR